MGTDIGITFLELRLPNRPLKIAGVVLHDPESHCIVVKMHKDWRGLADAEDEEVLAEYEHGLVKLASEMGAEPFLDHLDANFSHTIRPSCEYAVHRPAGNLDEYAEELLRQLR